MNGYGSEIIGLLKPFPAKYISQKGGSKYQADFVTHSVVEQKLIGVLGYPPDFLIREVVKDSEGKLIGVIGQMKAVIDQRLVTVEEAGDANEGEGPDASPLKNALSDAYKRCAMRLGVALHLWAGDQFFLYDVMLKNQKDVGAGTNAQSLETGSLATALVERPAPTHSSGAVVDGEAAAAPDDTPEPTPSGSGTEEEGSAPETSGQLGMDPKPASPPHSIVVPDEPKPGTPEHAEMTAKLEAGAKARAGAK
jgi:hypothetical protein